MKPVDLQHLPNANGLEVEPHETALMFALLGKIALSDPITDDDRKAAKSFLLRAFLTYPEYANVGQASRGGGTQIVRPSISKVRHTKKRR